MNARACGVRVEPNQPAGGLICINSRADVACFPFPELEAQMTRESGIKRTGVACLYIATIALALFLLVQHWFHVPQYLPYLLFLACPLMPPIPGL
jgi:hypothetical protein